MPMSSLLVSHSHCVMVKHNSLPDVVKRLAKKSLNTLTYVDRNSSVAQSQLSWFHYTGSAMQTSGIIAGSDIKVTKNVTM